MIRRSELDQYLQVFLACDQFVDYAPNGLQVEGKEEVKRICTAVTASAAAIEEAIQFKADALLVHHGYFWRGEDPVLLGMKRHRLAQLLQHDLNLFAYHLPLDCHANFGNNACLSHLFSFKNVTTHRAGNTADLLWLGELSQPLDGLAFSQLVEAKLGRAPQHIAVEKLIQRVAFCTGSAQDFITQASQLGADAYLSGEISERTFYEAKELNIHYFACGHHATERYGIQALGTHLQDKFDLAHHYIETNNPV